MKFKFLWMIVSMILSLSSIAVAEENAISPDGGDQSMQVATNDSSPALNSDDNSSMVNSDNNNSDVKVVDAGPISGADDSEVNIDTTTGDDDY